MKVKVGSKVGYIGKIKEDDRLFYIEGEVVSFGKTTFAVNGIRRISEKDLLENTKKMLDNERFYLYEPLLTNSSISVSAKQAMRYYNDLKEEENE